MIVTWTPLFAATAGAAVPQSAHDGKRSVLEVQLPEGWQASVASNQVRNNLSLMKDRLAKDPALVLVLTGHTDLIGSPEQNLAIGYLYARNLSDQLVDSLGFDETRIRIASAGETAPLVSHGTFAEQASNRRVVVSLQTPDVSQDLSKDEPAAPRKVILLEPQPGTVDRAYQRVRAIVEGRTKTALLTLNGVSTMVAVLESRIEGEVVLSPGNNTVEIIAWDESGTFGKDQVEVIYVPPPPAIEVFRPQDGDLFDTTHSPVVEVLGRIDSSIPLQETFMFLNGAPRRIEVAPDGTFSQPVVLIRQSNSLRVEALNIHRKTATSPEITVKTMNLIPKDLVVFLTWDKPDIDLDLHIYGPGGKHTYYGGLDPFESRDAIPGGGLDLDDKNGFGPEVFTLYSGQAGSYNVLARYHHSPTGEPCMATVTVVLHPAEPARRLTRIFGPWKMEPGSLEEWKVTTVEMPFGTFAQ